MKRILITGGAGFIGSNLINYWIKNYPTDYIINLDILTYASNLDYISKVTNNENYTFIQSNLCNQHTLKKIINFYEPDHVLHLAAETHVDQSIINPKKFIDSNIVGTFNLLEACLQYWHKSNKLEKSRFVHISTDEVYGTLEDSSDLFNENSPIEPNSPYSASKASSDHLVRSYNRTYGMQTIVTRCSNNFGPNQHDEKLIPKTIKYAILNKNIPIYGKGENIRDWLFVEDHCSAIASVFNLGKSGEIYNIGGKNEWRNIDIVTKICDLLNEIVSKGPKNDYKNLISFVDDRLGHDYRYGLDTNKVQKELNWKPKWDFENALLKTINWYLIKYSGGR